VIRGLGKLLSGLYSSEMYKAVMWFCFFSTPSQLIVTCPVLHMYAGLTKQRASIIQTTLREDRGGRICVE
jgi:hypothetical protein